ncbi:MAG: hypothetical protein K0S53_3398 [Bacteroidetes bacterium]|jgi:hypothetical protein|nr:hypothetical protein [Bacteroidota bacterium]
MKKIALLLLLSFSAQKKLAQVLPPSSFMDCLNRPEIQTEDVVLNTGKSDTIEENVKWALNKYWIKPTNIRTKNFKDPSDLSCSYVSVSDYETEGESGNFYNTHFRVVNQMKPTDGNIIFELSFDNMIAKDDKTATVIGADKDVDLLSDKALTYTMLFCSVTKNFSNDFGSFRKAIKAYNTYLEKSKEKLKTTTMLIPKELMDNGLTNASLNGLNIKYQILPSSEITKKIKDGKDVKNYSELIIIKSDKINDYAYLVDLENGDLISYSNLGANIATKTYKYMNDERFNKLLRKLIE